MKRNYNGVNKGKVVPLTEVKPGMVFRIVSKEVSVVVDWLFWCNGAGVFCTAGGRTSQIPKQGYDGHDHWKELVYNRAMIVNSFDKRAV